MTYDRPEMFHEVVKNSAFISEIVNLNVVAVTAMTRCVLPGMLNRGRGVIINIGTCLALYGCAYFTLYAATKAFMQSLTLDLSLEYKGSGVLFQYQAPGYVTTKLAKIKEPSLFVPTPEQYAKVGLNSVGLQQGTIVWLPQRAFGFGGRVIARISPEYVRHLMFSGVRMFWLYAKKREMLRNKFSNKDCSVIV
jgi:17beta-estradiol 17-dehydrogenase / very-long-chain 3-oxoacyl-CoA reductase